MVLYMQKENMVKCSITSLPTEEVKGTVAAKQSLRLLVLKV